MATFPSVSRRLERCTLPSQRWAGDKGRLWRGLALGGGSLVGFLCILLVLGGCDSAPPTAPAGTTLSVSANPLRIASRGTSSVRVIARKANGNPVNPGTLITLTTTLGTIPGNVPTDDLGEAIATLTGTGQDGMATVTASTGASESVTVDIQIGLNAGSISLQANPASVPETGGEMTLTAIVRDEVGQPLAGANVNFVTRIGTLESGGAIRPTDEFGSVKDTLVVSASDVDTLAGDSFDVSADAGSASGQLSASTTVSIQRLPRADFLSSVNGLTAAFTDTSTGNPTGWTWEFGDGSTSREQNPAHSYGQVGTYAVTLQARNSLGESTTTKFVAITGQ